MHLRTVAHSKIKLAVRFAYIFLALMTTPTLAEVAGEAARIREFIDFLGNLNRYSPLEAAGSHGSYGTHVGLGGTTQRLEKSSNLHRDIFRSEEFQDGTNVALPKLTLLRGTSFPVDIGLSAANISATKVYQYAGYLQWTLFESLDWPALALRGAYANLQGLKGAKAVTYSADVVASYGLFRYLTAYGAWGVQRHDITINYEQRDDSTAALASKGYVASFKQNQRTLAASHLYGIKLALIPPFYTLAVEYQDLAAGVSAYAAKLNVEM